MKSLHIVSDPEILGGTPEFIGTRVPARIVFERLEAGDVAAVLLHDDPSVSRNLAVLVLEDAKASMVADAYPACRVGPLSARPPNSLATRPRRSSAMGRWASGTASLLPSQPHASTHAPT